MSGPFVPPPVTGPLPPAVAAQRLSGTIPNPPADLRALVQGATLDAVVLLNAARGQVSLSSERFGTFSLRAPFALSGGNTVTLQVAQTGPQMQVRLLAINGQPVQGGGTMRPGAIPGGGAGALAAPGTGMGGMAVPPGGAAGLAGGTMPGGGAVTAGGGIGAAGTGLAGALDAVVVGGGGAAAGPGQLATGTRLVVRLATAGAQPAGGASGVPATGPQATAPQQRGGPPVAGPLADGSAAARVGGGVSALATTTAPTMPVLPPGAGGGAGSGLPGLPGAGAGGGALPTLTGTVVGGTPGAPPAVQTPAGLVLVNTRADLPPGTGVVLDILSQSPPPPAARGMAGAVGPMGAPLPTLTGSPPAWSGLGEALVVLQREDPVAAQALFNALPAANGRLAATMVTLLAAARAGDAKVWPGEPTLKALERTGPRGALLARLLGDEVAGMAGGRGRAGGPPGPAGPAGGDWRLTTLPFLNGAVIEPITLSVRDLPPPDDEDEEAMGRGRRGGGGMRFLIDLDLSRLGPVQLDGLVRVTDRHFDLILRSRAALPDDMRRDITGLYAQAGAALNIAGSVTFQVTEAFVVPVPADPPGHDGARPNSLFGFVV